MIQSLRVQNFRSYADAQFEFESGVTIIVGPNASGKTSIIEALYMLLQGGLFKGSEQDVLRFSEEWARIDGQFDGGAGRTVKLQVQPDGRVKKSYVLDEQAKLRFPATARIPVVLFEPQHMSLLSGEPALRRDFLDTVLGGLTHTYSTHLKNYRRVVAQRNALLKQPNRSAQDLFIWDLRLSELGGVIYAARQQLVLRFNERLTSEYQTISARSDQVEMTYHTTVPTGDYASNLLKKLEAERDKDFARGFTGSGPHRDDFVLKINGHEAQSSASRGETRSLLLALKVLEVYELENATKQAPILLLDDVFSELDGRRRRALADTLKNYQTFITTTDADLAVEHFKDVTTVIATEPSTPTQGS